MQRKFVAATIVLSFVGVGQPMYAQPIQVRMDKQSHAQISLSPPARIRYVDVRLLLPMRADRSAVMSRQQVDRMMPFPQVGESHRSRHAIIGGVLGTVVGLATCTALSNIMDDSTNRRISTCTTTGNLMFAAGGLAVGALIGAAIK
ncbi:MAG: hypothetical protein ABJB74_07885 [Gemmatimonas sp.]